MDKGKGFSPPAIGGASLLAVFAVLCLTVFASHVRSRSKKPRKPASSDFSLLGKRDANRIPFLYLWAGA